MSETLNLGAGNWATKDGSLLGYNKENGNFKPLPFDFTRTSSATVVNKDGLIETVGAGEPRIDFKDNTKGSLLLEPSRTNLITFSEDFTEGVWGKTNTTVISNDTISPDGTLNASRLTDNATDGLHVLGDGTSFESGETYTATIFAKKGTASRIFVGAGNPATWGADCYFDLENGTVALESIGTASIEDYGNGWYRCTVVGNANADAATNALFGLADNSNDKTYIGSGDYVYFWGAQLEQGSYATSYIPTQGSVVTRLAEVCNNGGNEQVINSTEGVLYAEVSALANDSVIEGISINDGSISNRVVFFKWNTPNTIKVRIANTSTGNVVNENIIVNDITETQKIAIKYKLNDFNIYLNGFKVFSLNNGLTPLNLSVLGFDGGGGFSPFYGKVKDLRVYNTALTDQELQALTS